MKIVAVLNPISGGNDKDDFIEYFKETSSFYGIETAIFETTGTNDLKKLAKFLKSDSFDLIMAVGGDGTFALAALASANGKTSVGIIPFGSANGMAKELGVNQDPNMAFDDLLKSRIARKMDMLCINDSVKSIHLADIGVNARVVKAFEEDENRGMLTYGKYFARELQNMERIEYSVEANGETISGHCVMIIIANGRKFGTGVSITEFGNPFDGVFEIVIVEEINLGTILKAGLSAIDQLYTPQNVSRIITTEKAVISFSNPQFLQADGEVIGEFDQLNVKMLAEEFLFQTHLGNPYISNDAKQGDSEID